MCTQFYIQSFTTFVCYALEHSNINISKQRECNLRLNGFSFVFFFRSIFNWWQNHFHFESLAIDISFSRLSSDSIYFLIPKNVFMHLKNLFQFKISIPLHRIISIMEIGCDKNILKLTIQAIKVKYIIDLSGQLFRFFHFWIWKSVDNYVRNNNVKCRQR